MNARSCLFVALALGAILGCDGDRTITAPRFSDLPASAREKLTRETDPERITRIEREFDAGRSVYHVSFVRNGEHVKIIVSDRGMIISDSRNPVIHEPAGAALSFGKVSARSKFNALPVPVQRAIGARTSTRFEIVNVRPVARGGRAAYEIEFAASGKNPKMFVLEDGTVIEDQRDSFRQ